MVARSELLIVNSGGGSGGTLHGTLYLHVKTGNMAVKTDNVVGGAWAVSFTSILNPLVSAWGSADGLTEDEADAIVAEWISKL